MKLHSEHRGIYVILFVLHEFTVLISEFFSNVLATPILFPWIYIKFLLAINYLENFKSEVQCCFTYTFLLEYFQMIILIKGYFTKRFLLQTILFFFFL